MRRRDEERLDDIDAAILAIAGYLKRGDLGDGLIFDAVRVRLIEIGEAVKGITRASRRRSRDPVAGRRWHAGSTRPPLLRHLARNCPSHSRSRSSDLEGGCRPTSSAGSGVKYC